MSERTLFDYEGPTISEQCGCEPSIKKLIKLYYRAYGIVGSEAENLVEHYIKGWLLLHGEKEQPWPGPDDILKMRGKEKPTLRGMTIEEIQRNYPKEYAQALTEAEELTKEQPPAGLFHGPGLPKKKTDKEYCICGKPDHPIPCLQPTEEVMTPDPGPEWFRQQIKDPQCQAEALLLDLTEKIVEIHGQYRGRYYWLWRLLEWTATKLIWRKP